MTPDLDNSFANDGSFSDEDWNSVRDIWIEVEDDPFVLEAIV